MVYLRDAPLSGNRILDWIFKEFLLFLNNEVHIKRKKRLSDPSDKHRRALRGLMFPDTHPIEIGISSAKSVHPDRDAETETLIHEVSHILFHTAREQDIKRVEKILREEFTPEQKKLLKSFLPRHEVKS